MTKESKHRVLSLVIADDDTEDQFLIQKAIWEIDPNHKITSVYNGRQLMDYLLRQGLFKTCRDPLPDCIFLDLRMPLLSGTEVLGKIKSDKGLTAIPVYIISSDSSEDDQRKLLRMGAEGFYTKTSDYSKLKMAVGKIVRPLSGLMERGM
jgi:CheY-like chemotaxis protein